MDSGNNSSSLQSSSGGGGDEEFDSRTFFATNINASATNNANSNGFSISNNNTVTTTTTTTNNNNNNFPNFLDNFSFLVPASSSFPLLLDPRSPPDDPAPAKTAATPANRPSTTLSSSPRSTTSSRKRSRASRRAPTTVLTTDTSNFRAMVQEFTGIPSPPFASSSSSSAPPYPPPPRSRFDFFNPALSAGATPSPLFLLKPYPHKPFHFPNAHATTTAANINYLPQQPPSSSNFGHNNSLSLLQSELGAMPSTSTAAADYGSVNVGDLGQLTGAIGSGWGQDAGVDPTSSLLKQATNGACKLNYSAVGVAAEFGAEKGGEARGEGMVESWICSSD